MCNLNVTIKGERGVSNREWRERSNAETKRRGKRAKKQAKQRLGGMSSPFMRSSPRWCSPPCRGDRYPLGLLKGEGRGLALVGEGERSAKEAKGKKLTCSSEMLENFNSIPLLSSVISSSTLAPNAVLAMLSPELAAKGLNSLTTLRGGDEGEPDGEGEDPGREGLAGYREEEGVEPVREA